MSKRSQAQREADLNEIAKMYVRQTPQWQIARRLGMSQPTVSLEIKRLLRRWEETRLDEINKYKHEQLLRINEIEEELWRAWELSAKKGKKSVTKSKSGKYKDPSAGEKPDYWRAAVTEEEPVAGDMTYMNGIMWCVSERNKLLGIYAPKKVAQTDPTGEHEAVDAREELTRLISGVAKRMFEGEKKEETVKIEEDFIDGDFEEVASSPDFLANRLKEEMRRRLPAPRNEQGEQMGEQMGEQIEN